MIVDDTLSALRKELFTPIMLKTKETSYAQNMRVTFSHEGYNLACASRTDVFYYPSATDWLA